MKVVNIQVIGKVQGVAFRYYTKIKADGISIKGTVQNLPDGSVLICAQGVQESIGDLVSWCKNGGSPAASVDDVIISEIEYQMKQDFTEFLIIR